MCPSSPTPYPKFFLPLTTSHFLERFTWHSLLCFLFILYLLLPGSPASHPTLTRFSPPTFSLFMVIEVFPHIHSAPRAGESSTSFVSQMHHLFSFLFAFFYFLISHLSYQNALQTHLPFISNSSNQPSSRWCLNKIPKFKFNPVTSV